MFGCVMHQKEILMSITIREAKITWLNWKDMYYKAGETREDAFFDLSAVLARRIEALCGTDNLIEWLGEDLCEDCGFDPTVSYRVRNTAWPWNVMIADLQMLSAEFPEIIFQVTFIEGECSAKTYVHGGRLTAVLYDSNSGALILAF